MDPTSEPPNPPLQPTSSGTRAVDFVVLGRRSRLSGKALDELPDTALVVRNVTDYTWRVIRSFADRRTQMLYATGKSKSLPPEIARRALRKLEYVDLAIRLDDLRVPLGNRLHALARDRKGQHSIAVNDQWRICFRFVEGDAFDVEITDYH